MSQPTKSGVRSYANALLIANLYSNIPTRDADLHRFAIRVLRPSVKVVQLDCGTTIGTLMSTEEDVTGYIALDTNQPITEDYLSAKYAEGIYEVRTRDTSSCTASGGVCGKCLRGHLVKEERRIQGPLFNPSTSPSVSTPASAYLGRVVTLPGDPVAFQRYIANTYSGSLVGVAPVPSGDLPVRSGLWSAVLKHSDMDRMCDKLEKLGISQDELDYTRSVKDLLERALIIIAYYGVYGSANN